MPSPREIGVKNATLVPDLAEAARRDAAEEPREPDYRVNPVNPPDPPVPAKGLHS